MSRKILAEWSGWSLLDKAPAFARICHGNQVRKYTGEPYVNHCREVAFLVSCVIDNEDMICAAWLHDTVEDTDATIDDIKFHFNDHIAELVGWLTDVSKPEDGNRDTRKRIDREHSQQAPPSAQTIKLADLISNAHSITRYDKDFAKVYMREKALLLTVLLSGDRYLWALAEGIVTRYELANEKF